MASTLPFFMITLPYPKGFAASNELITTSASAFARRIRSVDLTSGISPQVTSTFSPLKFTPFIAPAVPGKFARSCSKILV